MVKFPRNFNRDLGDKPNKGKIAGLLIEELITLRDAYTCVYRILKETEKEKSKDSLYKVAVDMEEIIRKAPEERRVLEDILRQLEKQGISLSERMLENFRQELSDYESLARRYLERLN